MAAMMFPSIAPMVVMHVRIQEGRRERGQRSPVGATALFVAGYLITWAAAGLVGYGALRARKGADRRRLRLGQRRPLPGRRRHPRGGRLPADSAQGRLPAPLPQPLHVPDEALAAGPAGRAADGVIHGGWCVGCCWALMAALFALGVMSIGWMAFVAALIAIEKLLPWRALANRGIAVLLLVLGAGRWRSPRRASRA